MAHSDNPDTPPLQDSLLAALWDASGLALLLVDDRLHVRHANPAARALLGARSAPIEELVEPEDAARLRRLLGRRPRVAASCLLRAVRDGAEPGSGESGAGQESVWVDLVDVPHAGGDDLTLLVGRDAAARIEREARVRRAGRLEIVGRAARAIGHELNNALGTVTTLTDLMLGDVEPGSQAATDLTQIRDAAWEAVRISRRLSAFARGHAEVPPEGTDLTLCLEAIGPFARRLLPRDVQVETHVQEGCGSALIAPGALDETLVALVDNAGQVMAEGGVLRITASNGASEELPGPYVVIEVQDDGQEGWPVGVDEALDPFFSTRDLIAGTGLGLSTVDAFVRAAGGSVSVEPGRERGTTVRLCIPAPPPDG